MLYGFTASAPATKACDGGDGGLSGARSWNINYTQFVQTKRERENYFTHTVPLTCKSIVGMPASMLSDIRALQKKIYVQKLIKTDNAIFILISIVLLLLFVPVDLRRNEMC